MKPLKLVQKTHRHLRSFSIKFLTIYTVKIQLRNNCEMFTNSMEYLMEVCRIASKEGVQIKTANL